MSGVQGALETRAATTVTTPAALSLMDATPWSTGELACVLSLSTPGNPALFVLQREDVVSVVNGTTVLAVGPSSLAAGRWLRLNVTSGSTPLINIVSEVLLVDTSTLSQTFVTLLTASITTTAPASRLLISAGATGEADTEDAQLHFAVNVDGGIVPQPGQVFGFTAAGAVESPNNGALPGLLVDVVAGVHTITLLWKTNGAQQTISVLPVTHPDYESAYITVQEV